jgi:hypothetical protein
VDDTPSPLRIKFTFVILKTQEDNIIKKYITYVYKTFNIGAPDINEEMKTDLEQFGKNIANFYKFQNITSI